MRDADRLPTVLLVEDDYLVCECTVMLFNELGLEVIEAADGVEGLVLLNRHDHIRLLFSDCRLPGMDGPTLASRALKLRPGLPIVLATGFFEEYQTDWPTLHKPYSLRDVRAVLRQVLPELMAEVL